MSRDFFADQESNIDININTQPDFDKKNPFPTIMDPVLTKNQSDISALNINESAFDMNESVNDLIQRDDSFLGKDTSFRHLDASNDGVYLESDLNNSEIRKHNVSYTKAQTYAPFNFVNGIDVIHEDNENSSSQNHQSIEESKERKKSPNSISKKKSTETEEDDDRESMENFFPHEDINSPLHFLDSFRDSNKELDGEIQKFSFSNLKPIEKKEDITLDFDRGSSKRSRNK